MILLPYSVPVPYSYFILHTTPEQSCLAPVFTGAGHDCSGVNSYRVLHNFMIINNNIYTFEHSKYGTVLCTVYCVLYCMICAAAAIFVPHFAFSLQQHPQSTPHQFDAQARDVTVANVINTMHSVSMRYTKPSQNAVCPAEFIDGLALSSTCASAVWQFVLNPITSTTSLNATSTETAQAHEYVTAST